MAHYALLDENNIVVQVITGVDENIIQTDSDGTQVGGSSEAWEAFYASRPEFEGLTCKRTSYNARRGANVFGGDSFRKNFAGSGSTYDPIRDAFIPPKMHPSWVLDEETCLWEAPTPRPTDGKSYIWDDETTSWTEV